MTNNLQPTPLLDYQAPIIQQLIAKEGWRMTSTEGQIAAVYEFVRNQIKFGYNVTDNIPASAVLSDGYGQCNTKATLLMALLRALNIPTQLHGFTIDKSLQLGAIPRWLQPLAPNKIIHTWVEVRVANQWTALEGVILDDGYLKQIQAIASELNSDSFNGFAIACQSLSSPKTDWQGEATFIQKEGIVDDFGVFADPDSFYETHGTNLGPLKHLMFAYFARPLINQNIVRLREQGLTTSDIALIKEMNPKTSDNGI